MYQSENEKLAEGTFDEIKDQTLTCVKDKISSE